MTVSEALAVLGLQPRCTEEDVRAALRRHIKRWHPDRFAHDDEMQADANHRMKQGNLAFEVLAAANFETDFLTDEESEEDDYDSDNETEEATWSSADPQEEYFAASRDTYSHTHSNTNSASAASAAATSTVTDAAASGRFHTAVGVVVGLLFLVALWQGGTRNTSNQPVPKPVSTRPVIVLPSAPRYAAAQPETGTARRPATQLENSVSEFVATASHERDRYGNTFTLGSSREEVAKAQGTPSKIDEHTWRYGNFPNHSLVEFQDDKVVAWDSKPQARLRTRGLASRDTAGWPKNFTIGSHKMLVAAVQGPPDRISGDVWYFGDFPSQSGVTFQNDRVVTWDSNPGRHLRVALLTPTSSRLPGEDDYDEAIAALYGINRSADAELANKLFLQAAQTGHPGACAELGRIFADGNGSIVGGQWAESDKWFRAAAETAKKQAEGIHPAAMFAYAHLLMRGLETERNQLAALEWLQQAGALDHVPSLIALAHVLGDQAASPVTALYRFELYRKAAAMNAYEAHAWLAWHYLYRESVGFGRGDGNALLEAGRQHKQDSCLHMAAHSLQDGTIMLLGSDGQPTKGSDGEKYAYQLLLEAHRLNPNCKMNHAKCIASCLFQGKGVAKNASLAMASMKLAASYDPSAMVEFADMIYAGTNVQQDSAKAETWYRSALGEWNARAKRGDLEAAFNAAQFYESGRGAERDLEKARELYRLAMCSFKPSIRRGAIQKLLAIGEAVESESLINAY